MSNESLVLMASSVCAMMGSTTVGWQPHALPCFVVSTEGTSFIECWDAVDEAQGSVRINEIEVQTTQGSTRDWLKRFQFVDIFCTVYHILCGGS